MAVAAALASTQERQGVVTFKGNPLTLIGPELKVGAKAPDFQVVGQDQAPLFSHEWTFGLIFFGLTIIELLILIIHG